LPQQNALISRIIHKHTSTRVSDLRTAIAAGEKTARDALPEIRSRLAEVKAGNQGAPAYGPEHQT
jgi:hypothetical protein